MRTVINTPNYDITIKSGADYQIDFRFASDDDSEIAQYGILIWGEILFLDDLSTIVSEVWNADEDIWSVDGEAVCGSTNWVPEAQLREFPEAFEHFDFQFSIDADGIHMTMPASETKKITYARGFYDVFITDSSGWRMKLIEGNARIIQQVTR